MPLRMAFFRSSGKSSPSIRVAAICRKTLPVARTLTCTPAGRTSCTAALACSSKSGEMSASPNTTSTTPGRCSSSRTMTCAMPSARTACSMAAVVPRLAFCKAWRARSRNSASVSSRWRGNKSTRLAMPSTPQIGLGIKHKLPTLTVSPPGSKERTATVTSRWPLGRNASWVVSNTGTSRPATRVPGGTGMSSGAGCEREKVTLPSMCPAFCRLMPSKATTLSSATSSAVSRNPY